MANICTVQSVDALNANVYKIRLLPQQPFSFFAGQYVELLLPEHTTPYAFSIANAPIDTHIELHIRHNATEAISAKIISALKQHTTIAISDAKGECTLKDNPNTPLIFIAASTCFAQIKSLLEHAFTQHFNQPLYFYWGVRHPHDFYLLELITSWLQQHPHFTFIPVVSDASTQWQGRHGDVHKAVMHDFESLTNMQVYACGSPKMIYAVLDDFVLHGLDETQFYSDVLDYAPRTR